MKVLDLINTSESAKELLLTRALYLNREYDVDNHVLCSDGPYVQALRREGITVHVVNTPRQLRPLAFVISYLKLLRLIRREQFNIIHSHGAVLGLLARLCRPFCRARIVHTVHGLQFHEGMRKAKLRFVAYSERVLLRFTDVTLSQNEEDYEIVRSWDRNARVELIGNGITLPANGHLYRSEAKNEYRFSCIARFEPVKNHKMLFDAFRKMIDTGVSARLLCLGQGRLLEEMRSYVEQLGLSDAVEFCGYVEDIFPLLRGVDLNLLTSVKEGIPRSLIEAMAAGVPTVATNVKGTREVIENGVTGSLVELGDSHGFARAVIDLLQNRGQRLRMSEACRKRAWDTFDERRICDRLFELYTAANGAAARS